MKIIKRLKNNPKAIFVILVLFVGILYYIWLRLTGIGIPCVIHEITGLYCPSCGITRMIVAASKLDFRNAIHENALIFILLPLWLIFAVMYNINIKAFKKIYHNEKLFCRCMIISIVLLIIFGVIRNIPYFSFFRPY